MYLAAIIDVFSRSIMGWGLSNTMEAEWCAEIAREAFLRHGRPEIFNTERQHQSRDYQTPDEVYKKVS